MQRVIVAGVLLVLCGVSGCGSGADGVVKAQVKTMNDLANALEANASEAEVDTIQKRLDHLRENLNDLKLSEAEERKLMEKYQPEMERATQRVMNATMKSAVKNLGNTNFPGTGGRNPFEVKSPFGGNSSAGGR
jgi:hypothetical protein